MIVRAAVVVGDMGEYRVRYSTVRSKLRGSKWKGMTGIP